MKISIEGAALPGDSKREGTMSTVQSYSMNDPLSFNIEVDAEGRILTISSEINMSDEAYYKAVETAWSNKNNNSTITIDGKQWKYHINPVSIQVLQVNGQGRTSP